MTYQRRLRAPFFFAETIWLNPTRILEMFCLNTNCGWPYFKAIFLTPPSFFAMIFATTSFKLRGICLRQYSKATPMHFITRPIVAFILMATSVQATPWEMPAPAEMTQDHIIYAESANRIQSSLKEGGFGLPPEEINWAKDHVMLRMPISNLSVPQLSHLITGRYFIFGLGSVNSPWAVRYHSPNGKTYFCEPFEGKYREWVLDRYVTQGSVGLGGIRYWDTSGDRPPRPPEDSNWGWSIVANPDTGEIGRYHLNGDKWTIEYGWLQDAFPSEASVHCPGLPRASLVNTRQSGETLKDLSRAAKPVRGFKVSFKNDPEKPLTAGMYYHLYPPVR